MDPGGRDDCGVSDTPTPIPPTYDRGDAPPPGRNHGGPRGSIGRRSLYDRRLRARSERWSLPGRLLAAVLAHPELVLTLARKRQSVECGGRVVNRGVQALLELSSIAERATTRGSGTPDPVETRDKRLVQGHAARVPRDRRAASGTIRGAPNGGD